MIMAILSVLGALLAIWLVLALLMSPLFLYDAASRSLRSRRGNSPPSIWGEFEPAPCATWRQWLHQVSTGLLLLALLYGLPGALVQWLAPAR